jgi:hypothetical protein
MDPIDEKLGASGGEKPKPNYPGPKNGVVYPLTVVYCGGRHFFLAFVLAFVFIFFYIHQRMQLAIGSLRVFTKSGRVQRMA